MITCQQMSSLLSLYFSTHWKQPWVCTAYMYQRSRDNQIKSDKRGHQSCHHSKSTKQILHSKGGQHIMFHDLTYHFCTWQNGVITWPDKTSRFKPRAFGTITATHIHTIFLFQVLMLVEKAQQFLVLWANKKLLHYMKNTKLDRNNLVPKYICLHILSSISMVKYDRTIWKERKAK